MGFLPWIRLRYISCKVLELCGFAWLLEELGLDYNLEYSERASDGLGPPEFAQKAGTPLGRSPTIKDGDLVMTESGAITE